MERRLLIAFALSFLVIMLSRRLWEPQKPPVVSPPIQTSQTSTRVQQDSTTVPGPVNQLKLGTRKAESERLIEVDSDLYRITLSNREAVVRSWILKKYTDSDGKPLDLINPQKADLFGYPLGLKVDREDDISKTLSRALFFTQAPAKIDLIGQPTKDITFEYSEQDLRVQKRMVFTQGSYLVQVECQVWQNGKPCNYLLLWRSGFGDSSVEERLAVHRVLYRNENKVTRIKANDVQVEQDLSGSFGFVGEEDQYFAAVVLPGLGEPIRRIQLGRDEHSLENGKKEQLLRVGAFGSYDHGNFKLFVAPKDTQVLQQAGNNLNELIDYGWFAIVCKPLFLALRSIYSVCRNYGLAIILLTVIINLALFPLRYKSIVSAQKMQKLQPQMKAIQERYKKLKPTDPKRQQMNTELMALYKQHGVNPLGGCLPLLLQMPFFIAFYNLLSVSIELRHAPFFLWIKDLSASDPTFVLPILMTVSMIGMQRMTPTPSADPVQAKMMMAMPLVFGFMLAFTSSGLVLYWLTSNVVGIGQQYLMNKYGPSPTSHSSKQGKKK
jgi:YidC/Oxa1 family membrane protein insertase